jgi:MFS superfamily sulfate permease-like transporter
MAYAELAGLPPVTGLCTSILCLVGYAIFGPSKILVLGPASSLGPMTAAPIVSLVGANGDPERAVARVPAVLAAVASILAANVFHLADHGVALVGALPKGLPPFTLPHVPLSDMALLVGGAFGIEGSGPAQD